MFSRRITRLPRSASVTGARAVTTPPSSKTPPPVRAPGPSTPPVLPRPAPLLLPEVASRPTEPGLTPLQLRAARVTSAEVVARCEQYVQVQHEGEEGMVVTQISRHDFAFPGNPKYATLESLRTSLERHWESLQHPEIQRRFRDLLPNELDTLDFDELSASFAAPQGKGHVLYSGCHHLSQAQIGLWKPMPRFVTTDLDEAHHYSNQSSVVVRLWAEKLDHLTSDVQFGATEWTTGERARADEVRVTGIIRGRGDYRNPSALGGTSYE